MCASASQVGIEGQQVIQPDPELRDIADAVRGSVLGVPVPGDLDRVLLLEDWIEDGLFRKPRRELLPTPGTYEVQLRPNPPGIQRRSYPLQTIGAPHAAPVRQSRCR